MKKFLSLIVVICLVISLTACGDVTKEADKLASAYEFDELVALYEETDLTDDERKYISDVITTSGTEYILKVLEESEDDLYVYENVQELHSVTNVFEKLTDTHPELSEASVLIRDIMFETQALNAGTYDSISADKLEYRDFYVDSRVENLNHFEIAGVGNAEYLDQYVCTDAEYNMWLEGMGPGYNEYFILMSDAKVQKGYHDYCDLEFIGYDTYTTSDGFEQELPIYRELSGEYGQKVYSIVYVHGGDIESYVNQTIKQKIYLIKKTLDADTASGATTREKLDEYIAFYGDRDTWEFDSTIEYDGTVCDMYLNSSGDWCILVEISAPYAIYDGPVGSEAEKVWENGTPY